MMILVPLSQIDDNPFQKRAIYDNIEELAADILSHQQSRPDTLGLQQIPNGRLIIRNARYDGVPVADSFPMPTSKQEWDPALRCQLEFGHRRLRAFQCLAQSHDDYAYMPVFIRPLTDDQMLDGVWSENRQRRDLSAVEEAELLKDKLERLQANGGGSQREVAEAWGLARPTVANRLRLLELPAEIQQANREGKLSERQCLALSTVVKIGEAADPKVQWHGGAHYGAPTAPADYIADVIKDGKTSDQIRQYSDRILRHAGKELPKPLADFDFTQHADWMDVEQYTCRGCRYRHNDTCLKRPCLEAKQKLYGEQAARAAAAELNLPYSDNPDHFSRYLGWKGADERNELEIVHKAGVSNQIVIGYWIDGDSALRLDGSGWMGDSSLWEDDGRNLVILGHKTPIDRELLAHAQAKLMDAAEADGEEIEIEDIPEKFEVEEWEKEAKKIVRAVTKRAKTAVLEALSYEIAGSDTIQALLCRKNEAWLDPEAMLKKLRDHLWNNGNGVGYSYGMADEVEEATAMLDRAGIGRAVAWESEVERLTAAAMFVLVWWYGRRHWASSLQLIEAREKLQPVREEFDNHRHEPDLATWSYELDRAWRDVGAKIAAEETAAAVSEEEEEEETAGEDGSEGEETAVTCEHCGKRPANVRGEERLLPYCDKCWQGELTDLLYCPACKTPSTVAKSKGAEVVIECWGCKAETAKGEWIENRYKHEYSEREE